VDGRDPNGHALLILAAYHGSLEAVDLLLAKGAHPNLQDNMGTALMAASFKGYAPIVRKLIASGAKVDDRNGTGASVLRLSLNFRAASQPLRPMRSNRSWNRGSGRKGSKAGRMRTPGLKRSA
jgi:ankyrin repeat protein